MKKLRTNEGELRNAQKVLGAGGPRTKDEMLTAPIVPNRWERRYAKRHKRALP